MIFGLAVLLLCFALTARIPSQFRVVISSSVRVGMYAQHSWSVLELAPLVFFEKSCCCGPQAHFVVPATLSTLQQWRWTDVTSCRPLQSFSPLFVVQRFLAWSELPLRLENLFSLNRAWSFLQQSSFPINCAIVVLCVFFLHGAVTKILVDGMCAIARRILASLLWITCLMCSLGIVLGR